MSDITIQQTLKIQNGRLIPSTDSLDADLIEISKEPGNNLLLKEDGLFVQVSEGSSTTVTGHSKTYVMRGGEDSGESAESVELICYVPLDSVGIDEVAGVQSILIENISQYKLSNLSKVVAIMPDHLNPNSNDSKVLLDLNQFVVSTFNNGVIDSTVIRYSENVFPYNHIQVDKNKFIYHYNINTVFSDTKEEISIKEILEGSRKISFNPETISHYSRLITIIVNGEVILSGIDLYRYISDTSMVYQFVAGDVVQVLKSHPDGSTYTSNEYTVASSNVILGKTMYSGDTVVSGTTTPNSDVSINIIPAGYDATVQSDSNGLFVFSLPSPLQTYDCVTINNSLVSYVTVDPADLYENFYKIIISGSRKVVEDIDVTYIEASIMPDSNTAPTNLENSIPLYTLNKDGKYVLTQPDNWIKIGDNYVPSYTASTISL